jgi:hypothetical protein
MLIANIAIGIAVLGFLIYRQVRVRPVRASLRLPLILGVIGVLQLSQYLKTVHDTGTVAAGLAGSLLLAAAFGAARAATVRVWSAGGQLLAQGNWVTAGLWLVSAAAHFGYDALVVPASFKGLATVSILLYLAVSYAVQRLIVLYRAQRLPARPGLAAGPGGAADSFSQAR